MWSGYSGALTVRQLVVTTQADKYVKMVVVVRNTGSEVMNSFRYMRTLNPSQEKMYASPTPACKTIARVSLTSCVLFLLPSACPQLVRLPIHVKLPEESGGWLCALNDGL